MSTTGLIVLGVIFAALIAVALWAIKKLPKTEEMTSEDREIWVQAMMVDPFLNYPVL